MHAACTLARIVTSLTSLASALQMFINFSYVFSAKKKQPEKRPENKVKFSASFVFSRSHNEHEGHGLQTGCACVCVCVLYLVDTQICIYQIQFGICQKLLLLLLLLLFCTFPLTFITFCVRISEWINMNSPSESSSASNESSKLFICLACTINMFLISTVCDLCQRDLFSLNCTPRECEQSSNICTVP